jgi:hypothetical protein
MTIPKEPGVETWLSIVVTCMGRLDHLRQTIPSLIRQDSGVEIVLVDWSCPDLCGAYASEHWPGVRVVKVPGQKQFHKSAALNAGARVASAPWLAILDADMIASSEFFENLRSGLRPDVLLGLADDRLTGFLACKRDGFDRTGGYDERMVGWGFEDDDMRRRLLEQGLRLEALPAGSIQVIPHDDESRTRFYAEKDLSQSALFNQALVWQARWVPPSLRRERWPANPVMIPSGVTPGPLFRSAEFALHVRWRIGVPGVRLLAETRATEQALREILGVIDSPGSVDLVFGSRDTFTPESLIDLPFGLWRFRYFPVRPSWQGWPDAKAHGSIAVGSMNSHERERLVLSLPRFDIIALDARDSIGMVTKILRNCDLLIDRSGGFAHVASAMGVPVFLLADAPAELSTLFRDEFDLEVLVCSSFENVLAEVPAFLGVETESD